MVAAREYVVLGIMSGSSLDGLDLAVCRLLIDKDAETSISEWSILAAETDPYSLHWRARLESAPDLSGRELWRLHTDFGRWIGHRAAVFLSAHPTLSPTLVGSHGHTIFHDPDAHSTTQIGDGAALAAVVKLKTVTEFRGADVAAGGQGAPIAPVADKYLFPQYSTFLNLGGIANLSVRTSADNYLAGDISGCCQVIDRLAGLLGFPYDDGGRLAAAGQFNSDLADRLEALPFHHMPYPKSLDNAWVREQLWPVLRNDSIAAGDRLRTFTVWLARKIVTDLLEVGAVAPTKYGTSWRVASEQVRSKVLVTGGGANNDFLINQLNGVVPELEFIVPEKQLANFKEAAMIALCAVLRVEGLPNALSSATGASRDTVNGAVYLPGL
ncbi:anhydro-N-acetylmuramic acid kinase [Neolewinella antarctica]|uniref:Anhydro-N-acetylmuramic acid kinase n=1 Tax=Neolewinella antarctica TaxID=442734 RepID=A0ABX0XGM9_9BACT|nr:anhydro-N-acetylmuramic acid kinase [Neolewinella antarctica]NJC28019.1 anhydro-N-acetylmuramic acid kinase [Neolewinella antarctica]